jgi:hypothetical protein
LSYLHKDERKSHSFIGRGIGGDWLDDPQPVQAKRFSPAAIFDRTSRAKDWAAPSGTANHRAARAG